MSRDRNSTGWRAFLRCAALLGAAIGRLLAQPGAAAGGLRPIQLREVASGRVFGNVNRNDARASLKAWFDMVARRKGYALDSTFDIADSVAEIRERLERHSVDLITLGVPDYLELEGSKLLLPVLTDARTAQGTAAYSYVLLVNAASGISSIAGLRGKSLLVYARGSGETGPAWAEVLLGKEKLGRAASFFASMKSVAKPPSCILPVFFGTVEACVVDEINLNLAKEMNPQLGRLKEVARSRPMIESVIAVPAEVHPYRQQLIDEMLSLHEDTRGRQLLMVFQTERMVRLQPGDLDAARDLWREYWRISGINPAARSEERH